MTFDDIRGVPEMQSVTRARSAVEDIVERGRVFFRDDWDTQHHSIGLALALRDALDYAGPNGFVATMPELIAARVAVAVPTGDPKILFDKRHWLWKHWYVAHSEENVVPNYTRRFYPEENHLVVVVHGGGLLTPDRILRAYDERAIWNISYNDEESRMLLNGQLADGALPLYAYSDIGAGTLPRRCGIVLPYSLVAAQHSGRYGKKEFVANPLVIARNGGVQHLEEYFDREQEHGIMGNWRDPFNDVNLNVPQGRVLFLSNVHGGLRCGLLNDGRFVGVRR